MLQSVLSSFTRFDTRLLLSGTSATVLLLACFHSCVYITGYTISILVVVVQGDKDKKDKTPTRIVAVALLFFYVGYNFLVYFIVLSTVEWRRLFVGPLFDRSVFDHRWAAFLFFEPIAQLLMVWLKTGCALHSLANQPPTMAVSSSNLLWIIRRSQRNRNVNDLPRISVVMPIYNEPLPSLMAAINSVVDTAYPMHRLHLILTFDDEDSTPFYRNVVHCLTSASIDLATVRKQGKHALDKFYACLEKKLNKEQGKPYESHPCIQDIDYHGLCITVCRFPHGGKRHAQMCAYRYLVNRYGNLPSIKPFLLFIDSDIQLDPLAINYFVYDLMTGKYREALTGLITCKTADTYSFLKVGVGIAFISVLSHAQIMQDTEYIESQMMQRTTEDYLGSVSCLPGAMAIVRFESLQSVAEQYFSQQQSTDSLDFARCHLGEDRYLTHLLMERCRQQYRIGFCCGARCKTEARRSWSFAAILLLMMSTGMLDVSAVDETEAPVVFRDAWQRDSYAVLARSVEGHSRASRPAALHVPEERPAVLVRINLRTGRPRWEYAHSNPHVADFRSNLGVCCWIRS